VKSIFKKYLREKTTNETVTFTWYKLSLFDIFAAFLVLILFVYLLGEQLQWEELWGLRIIPLDLTARATMLGTFILLSLYLMLNRKSVLVIGPKGIVLKKRSITGKRWNFSKNDIADLRAALQRNFYESDTGLYPETYIFSIALKSGKKIRVGSFNEEDCERLKAKLR